MTKEEQPGEVARGDQTRKTMWQYKVKGGSEWTYSRENPTTEPPVLIALQRLNGLSQKLIKEGILQSTTRKITPWCTFIN